MADISIPIMARFWAYLISNLASIFCSIFVLYYLLFDRQLRRSLHNHVVIVVLILNFISEITTIPLIIYQYRNGVVLIFIPFFCRTWKFIDTVTYVTTTRLVAWASIERHILIFHNRWIFTKKKRFYLHYLPIGLIVAHGIILYLVLNYFLACDDVFSPTEVFCGYYSCVYMEPIYPIFEFFTSGIANSFFIASFSAGLVIRVVLQKHRLHQQVNWRKQRKMTIQLILLTLVFYFFYLPTVVLGIAYASGVPFSSLELGFAYTQFFSYYINFFLPFTCAGVLPELQKKLQNTFLFWKWWKRSNAIGTIQNSH